jgi:hypothetical protein
MLRWDRYGFHKKRFKTRYAKLVFLHSVGSMGHCSAFWRVRVVKHRRIIFDAPVGPIWI